MNKTKKIIIGSLLGILVFMLTIGASRINTKSEQITTFDQSKDGISHNPLEYSSPEHLSAGAKLLLGTVNAILNK